MQIKKLKKLVYEIDQTTFISFQDVSEIIKR
ncbi:MAG: DUF2179 domain-containing protein [Selenomonadaceae bacterium]|nr:DUF2179 domain-containing protein [Selenomonadaceae bacterium]